MSKVKELYDTVKEKISDSGRLAQTIKGRIKGAQALHKAIKEGGTESYKKVGEILKQMAASAKDTASKKEYFKLIAAEARKQELSLAQLGRLFQTYIEVYKV